MLGTYAQVLAKSLGTPFLIIFVDVLVARRVASGHFQPHMRCTATSRAAVLIVRVGMRFASLVRN